MSAAHQFHDFGSKLTQLRTREHLIEYVAWQRGLRWAAADGTEPPQLPPRAPLSINLDLTTACNYRCDHCCDWDILNSGIRHDEQQLRSSLSRLAEDGLQSVILIGGGEPTVYPRFAEMVRFLKTELGLAVAVVSNGSRNDRILESAQWMEPGDWVRLSLDAGTNDTFQRMHRPHQPVSLEEICRWAPRIKERQPALQMGFSFILAWKGALRDDAAIVDNVDELPLATRLARDCKFDYISVKPFVTRDQADRSQVLDLHQSDEGAMTIIQRISSALHLARAFESPDFRIVESANLRALISDAPQELTRQPQRCHMQFFRQVLSPLGLFNCPAHRGLPEARIANRSAYASEEEAHRTRQFVGEFIETFDASERCQRVSCIYNSTNWMVERLIEDEQSLGDLPISSEGDCFL